MTRKPKTKVRQSDAAKVAVHQMPIGNIIVLEPARRNIDDKELDRLRKSIARDGLKTPLDVTKITDGLHSGKSLLVAGRHRYEACKALGWLFIPVRILTSAQAAGWEEAENLFRHLRVLDESEAMVRYAQKRIIPNLAKDRKGGLQPHDKNYSQIAKATGWSHKRIAEAYAHDGLPDDIKKMVRTRKLDDQRSYLTNLSKLDSPKAQQEFVSGAGPGHQKTRSNSAKRPEFAQLSRDQITSRVASLKELWAPSSLKRQYDVQLPEVKREFLRSLRP